MANYTVSILTDDVFNGGNLAAETADGGGLSLREALGSPTATATQATTSRSRSGSSAARCS